MASSVSPRRCCGRIVATAASPGSTESRARRYGAAAATSSPRAATPRSIFRTMAGAESRSSIANTRRSRSIERMEGHGAPEGEALSLEPSRAVADLTLKLVEEARLADARLAHDQHHLAVSRLGAAEALLQDLKLALAPDERRQPALGLDVEPGARARADASRATPTPARPSP